jgi:hypothetical protein
MKRIVKRNIYLGPSNSLNDEIFLTPIFMVLDVIKQDPYLEPFSSVLEARFDIRLTKATKIQKYSE